MTPWQQHVERWKDCRACKLCENRQHVVLAKGQLPCDLLLIGEAPGFSEDSDGVPFRGPAGLLLDDIVGEALSAHGRFGWVENGQGKRREWISDSLRLAWTNLVCCLPLDEDGNKTGQPLPEEIRACSERLVEFVRIADPQLIVCVGSIANDWLNSKMLRGITFDKDIPMIDITHPGAYLKPGVNPVQKSMGIKKSVVRIRNAVREMLEVNVP
jgi:DNA polymerase